MGNRLPLIGVSWIHKWLEEEGTGKLLWLGRMGMECTARKYLSGGLKLPEGPIHRGVPGIGCFVKGGAEGLELCLR